MTNNKITPIGGQHRSASSLLAEVMNDPSVKKVIVFTLDGAGSLSFGHFDCTHEEIAFASVVLARKAYTEDA
jgi:hypothetical protein